MSSVDQAEIAPPIVRELRGAGVDDSTIRTRGVAVSCAITPPDYAGAGLSAFKLAERLLQQGRLAFVLTRSRAEGNGQRMYREREGLPVVPEARMVRVTPERPKNPGRRGLLREAIPFAAGGLALAVSTARQLFARRCSYDVIHCFTPSWLSFHAILISKMLGKQVVLEATLIGRDDPRARPARDVFGVKYAARRLQYRLADRIVAISPALGDRFVESGYGGKVRVITRSVDVARFRPVAETNQVRIRDELGLPTSGPILLFVGQIGERKGADLLIPILSLVVDRRPEASLVIVGQAGETTRDQEINTRMRAVIEERGLAGRVHFVPRTGSIERYMQAATLFVFPSRREGFGTVVVEAMACGAVPVAFRIPGITDHIIRLGEDGFYVDTEDASAFAQVILQVLADPNSLARMAATAVRTARSRFSTGHIDSVYRSLYLELEADRTGARPVLATPA
jgi:L-malate glycosyltransferase